MSVWECKDNSFLEPIVYYKSIPASEESEVYFESESTFNTVIPFWSEENGL
jgi:hypothetical protein